MRNAAGAGPLVRRACRQRGGGSTNTIVVVGLDGFNPTMRRDLPDAGARTSLTVLGDDELVRPDCHDLPTLLELADGHSHHQARIDIALARGDWQVRSTSRMMLTSTPWGLSIQADRDAFAGDKRVDAPSRAERMLRDVG